jgi:2-alkyl-3-oxoalkanoate reductase
MSRILVTGSTGFLGTVVVDRLLAHGEKNLRCLVRPSSKLGKLDAILAKHGGGSKGVEVERFVGGLASQEAAAAAIAGCDVVYHVAAAMSGAPADMFLNTVVTTRNLLEAMRGAKAADGRPPKLVHVSSFGVYGASNYPRGTLLDETMGLETNPERRDPYSQAKLRQEQLVHEYKDKYGIPTVVLRPGVIYGPGGSAFSGRVGLNLAGLFLHLGGKNLLPLTYVENCAEAIVVAGRSRDAEGQVYNVVDDDLVTSAQWLSLYKKNVKKIPSVRIPYPMLMGISHLVLRYHAYSKGQLPAIFTPYKTQNAWGGNRFENAKLKSIGWAPIVKTEDGIARTFEDLKARA